MATDTLTPDFDVEVGTSKGTSYAVPSALLFVVLAALIAWGAVRVKADRSTLQAATAISETDSSVLTAPVAGSLQQLFVKPGDKVKQGQLLAVVSSSDLLQKYEAAQKALIEAKKQDVTTQAAIVPPALPGFSLPPAPRFDLNTIRPLPSSNSSAPPPVQASVDPYQEPAQAVDPALQAAISKAKQGLDTALDRQRLAQSELESAQSADQAANIPLAPLQTALDLAKAKKEKFQGLYNDGIISRAEFQQKQAELDTAQGNLDQATQNAQTSDDLLKAKQNQADAANKTVALAQGNLAKLQSTPGKSGKLVSKSPSNSPAPTAPPAMPVKATKIASNRSPASLPEPRKFAPIAHHQGRISMPSFGLGPAAVAPVKVAFSENKHSEAQMKVEAAEQNLKRLEGLLAACRIVATGDGAVTDVFAQPGQQVSDGAKLISILKPSSQRVIATFPHDQALRIRYGQPCEISFDAYPNRVFKGQVARFVESGDRRAPAKIEILLPDRLTVLSFLPPGAISHVKIKTS